MARTTKKETGLTPEEKLARALVPEAEQPYQVPENWCWAYSSYIFEIEYGKGLSTKELTETGYPVFGANGQIGFYSDYMFEAPQALMSCRGAYSGVMNISLPKSFVTSNSLVIQSNKLDLSPKYTCYLFESQDIRNLVTGTAQPQVTVQAFKDYPIPIVPKNEQQRIVDRIESLFAKLDEAKEKAQAVVDGFEDRKAAILHKAFTGDLTADWRNLKGISKDSWRECKLISILKAKPRNGYSPKPVNYETPCKSMTLSATTSGVFLPEYYKYIDEEIPEDSHLWLKPGDILIQRANSLEKVGTSALYTGREHEFIYPDLMMKLQINDQAIPEYVAYYLKTGNVMRFLRENATGTAGNMPKINQKVVSKIPVVLPLIDEQSEIVCKLEMMLSMEWSAKEVAKQVIDQIDTMKKSILARAFRGELGTNNPTDESAKELLKKIL